jgi:hypothetical protein
MQLLPIIRRARRPLSPPEDAAPAVPPAVVELPPPVPIVEISTAPVVEPKPKSDQRSANAPA